MADRRGPTPEEAQAFLDELNKQGQTGLVDPLPGLGEAALKLYGGASGKFPLWLKAIGGMEALKGGGEYSDAVVPKPVKVARANARLNTLDQGIKPKTPMPILQRAQQLGKTLIEGKPLRDRSTYYDAPYTVSGSLEKTKNIGTQMFPRNWGENATAQIKNPLLTQHYTSLRHLQSLVGYRKASELTNSTRKAVESGFLSKDLRKLGLRDSDLSAVLKTKYPNTELRDRVAEKVLTNAGYDSFIRPKKGMFVNLLDGGAANTIQVPGDKLPSPDNARILGQNQHFPFKRVTPPDTYFQRPINSPPVHTQPGISWDDYLKMPQSLGLKPNQGGRNLPDQNAVLAKIEEIRRLLGLGPR